MRSRSDVIHGLLLLSAMLAIFLPTLPFEFVYDDHYYIVRNRHMADGLTPANVVWSFTKYYFANWHPLTSLSYFLDTSLYGKTPWGYRLTNIVLHFINTWLVLLVGRKLTGRERLAWWMAGVFALHPLHLESVIWISERKDVLSILFGLWAILAYLEYARAPSVRGYAAVGGLLTLSLLSKQTLITFPFLLMLFDVWPLGRLRFREQGWPRQLGRLTLEKLPLLALAVFFGVAAMNAQKAGDAVSSNVPASVRAINAVNALAAYLRQSAWPTGLCAFYPHPFHRLRVDAWFIATALLLAAVCVFALFVFFRGKREASGYVATGWFWFLGTLMPMLGIIQLGSAAHADRYMYFPQIGLSLLVGIFFCRLADASSAGVRRFIAAAGYASVAILAAVSWHQAKHWESDVTLFRHALSITRDNSFSRINLADGLNTQAEQLLQAGETNRARQLLIEAEEHSRASLRLRVRQTGYHNLVRSLRLQGKLEEAAEVGEKAIKRFPESPLLWFSLGWVYEDADDSTRAADCYARAIEHFPTYVEAFNRLGLLIAKIDPAKAEGLFREALAVDSHHVEARANLGNALARQERFDEALAEYQRGLSLDPDNEKIKENMQLVEEELRRRD
jgi:tetratricopeptide (TPR) repeat protein